MEVGWSSTEEIGFISGILEIWFMHSQSQYRDSKNTSGNGHIMASSYDPSPMNAPTFHAYRDGINVKNKKGGGYTLLWNALGFCFFILLIIYGSLQSISRSTHEKVESLEKVESGSVSDSHIALPVGNDCSVVQLKRKDVVQHVETDSNPGSIIAIRVRHGLGNRLRSFASVLALSSKIPTIKQVILIWEQDIHCLASFHDLFKEQMESRTFPFEIVIRDSFDVNQYENYDFYDYSSCPSHQINVNRILRGDANALVESSYIIQSFYTKEDEYDTYTNSDFVISKVAIGKTIRDLLFKYGMNQMVLDVINKHNLNAIGIHIRSLTNLEQDVPGIEALQDNNSEMSEHDATVLGVGNMGGNKLLNNRKLCDVEYFIMKMKKLRRMNANLKVCKLFPIF